MRMIGESDSEPAKKLSVDLEAQGREPLARMGFQIYKIFWLGVVGLGIVPGNLEAAGCLQVSDSVACRIPANQCGAFGQLAYGARTDAQAPAFCHRINVTNCGGVALQVTLSDAVLGLTNVPLGTLSAGGTVGSMFVTNLVRDWARTTTNVAEATGIDGNGLSVSANDSAIAFVRPAGIGCRMLFSLNGQPPVESFGGEFILPYSVVWQAIITNSGQADLTNLVITSFTDDPLSCGFSPFILPGMLAAGAWTNIILCATGYSNCLSVTVSGSVQVRAMAAFEGTNCVWDIAGSNMVVASACQASLSLACGFGTIILSRGVPQTIIEPSGGAQDGPRLTTPCGILQQHARWYGLVPDSFYPEGIIDISSEGSSDDTFLAVFQGPLSSPATLTNVACNDDISTQSKQSRVHFKVNRNTSSLWLAVESKNNTTNNVRITHGYVPAIESSKFNSNGQFELRTGIAPALAYRFEAANFLAAQSLLWSNLLTTNPSVTVPELRLIDNSLRGTQRYYRLVPATPN